MRRAVEEIGEERWNAAKEEGFVFRGRLSSSAVALLWGISAKSQSTTGLLRAAAATQCSPIRLSVSDSIAARLPPISWPQTPMREILRCVRPRRVVEAAKSRCTQSYADRTSWMGVG